jgi:hypothetical protein
VDELPSWWYPGDPAAVGPEGRPVPGHRDSETMPTAVIEPAVVPVRRGPMGPPDVGPDKEAVAPGPAPRAWTLALALVASILVAFGVLYWMRATIAGRGDAMGARTPTRGPRAGDAGQGGGGETIVDGATTRPPIPEARAARPARRLQLLVPAYIYPGGEGRSQWDRLINAAGKVGLVLVVNPSSGPGADSDPEYAAAIAKAAGRGIKLLGYVDTGYGRRPAAAVKDDIDTWLGLYSRIGGFFLDRQSPEARHAGYFADIATYARGRLRGALVIGNPGMPCDESYLTRNAADAVCVLARADGFDAFELPANLRDYDASRFAALAPEVTDAATMRGMLRDAVIKRIGYFYVTDGRSPNPWDRLPSYWEDEVDTVARLQ